MANYEEWKVTIQDPVLGTVVTKVKQPAGDWGAEVDIDSLVVLRKAPKNGKYPALGESAFVLLYSRDANSEDDWYNWEWELPCNVCFVSNHRNYSDRGCEGYGTVGWEYKDFDIETGCYDDIRNKAVEIIDYRFGDALRPCNVVYEYYNGPEYDNVYECDDKSIKNSTVVLISSQEMDGFFKAHEDDVLYDAEAVYEFVDKKLTDEVLKAVTVPTYGPTVELPDWAWSYISLYDHSGKYWYRCGTARTDGWDTCSHAGVMYVHPKFIEEMKNSGKSEEELEKIAIEAIDRMCHVFSGDPASRVVHIHVGPTGYYEADNKCDGYVEESGLIFDDSVEEEVKNYKEWYEKSKYETVPFTVSSVEEDD